MEVFSLKVFLKNELIGCLFRKHYNIISDFSDFNIRKCFPKVFSKKYFYKIIVKQTFV